MFRRFLLLCLLPLAACATAVAPLPQYSLPEAWQQTAFTLDISEIRLENGYEMPLRFPYVEHQFPVSFYKALENWVQGRLQATGAGDNQLEILVEKAQVVEKELPVTSGVKGAFINEQAAQFDATLTVTFKLYGPRSFFPQSELTLNVSKTASLPEDASLEEREKLFHSMLLDCMQRFDSEAISQMQRRFQSIIVDSAQGH